MKNSKSVADKFTAIATTAIAIIALIVSINESKSTKEHNELSVKPILSMSTNSSSRNLSIRNDGLGPAILDSIIIMDNKRVALHKSKSQEDAWIKLLQSLNLPYTYSPEITKIEGVIREEVEYNMLYLGDSISLLDAQDILDHILKIAQVKVYYHSAYNISDSLVWPKK